MRASRALRLNISHGPYFDTSATAAKSLAVEIGNAIGTVNQPRDPLASHCEVVNLELCTTAADLLAPSLQQFKGCHIIDANPGAGLWSSTINNLLRPKRHVLVEDDARFDPFIDRLLQSDPSYSRVRYDGSHSQSLERVVDEGLVPRPEPSSDPSKPSTSLLVLINLTRGMSMFGGSPARQKIRRRERTSDLCREAWLRFGIQKNGPVRILAWVEEGTKDSLVPRTVTGASSSAAAQRYANHMHVVAEDYSHTTRADATSKPEWESTWEALKRMEAAGLQIPPNRQNPLHKTLLRLREDWPRTWERFMNTVRKDLDQLDIPVGNKARHPPRRAIAPLLQEGDEVMRLERLAVDDSQPKEVQVAAREEYEKRYAKLHRAVSSLPSARRLHFNQDMDRLALWRRDPPGSLWDRRPFEPVECRKEDFCTIFGRPLSLLDICPKRPAQQHSPFDLIYWERLVSRLLERSAQPLSNAFDMISPGASELIMPKLSVLRDPLRYGSLHPEHVRARMLTTEMLDELVQVWKTWPSRPRHIDDEILKIETSWISSYTDRKPERAMS
ncbi:uncharacterized protein J3D65DRAFT_231622 [Phyllosticta citribraziliensis]|uniref:Mitochondrial transcription factor 1 n=1 Tax=Phyllosticta citribraziliensis TaxID=989973 RepID=A0ABR1M8L4_9PEZI